MFSYKRTLVGLYLIVISNELRGMSQKGQKDPRDDIRP